MGSGDRSNRSANCLCNCVTIPFAQAARPATLSAWVKTTTTFGLKEMDFLEWEATNRSQFSNSWYTSAGCFFASMYTFLNGLETRRNEDRFPVSLRLGNMKSWKAWNSSWPPISQMHLIPTLFFKPNISIPHVRSASWRSPWSNFWMLSWDLITRSLQGLR